MSSVDVSQTVPQKALLAAPEKPPAPVSKMIVEVARETGVSPFKQMREMFKLQRKAGISFGEYYAAQHYRTDLSPEEKLQFVGEIGSYKLNLRLSPAKLGDKRAFIRDKVLYTTMLRGMDVPSPKAMSDNFWQSGSMLGAVDAETGQVSHAITGAGMDRTILEQHPVSGKSFAGFQVPAWDDVKKIACQGHSMFPEYGVFGWDIAVTDDGPLIIECNANPFHTLYQLAHDRGINNPEFVPIFEKVEARTQKILQERTAQYKKLRKEQLA